MPLVSAVARRIRSGVRRRVDRLMDRVGLGVPPAPPPAPAPTAASAPAPAPVAEVAPSGPQITREQVEALFEDMVRPALQSDGGDITLIDVKDNDVYVRLLGACETCPSAIMTMQMGIERLLQEEFPHFGRLIRIDEPAGAAPEAGYPSGA